jgi:hypothetical protein
MYMAHVSAFGDMKVAQLLKELPGKVDGFEYVPMLLDNQSPLELQFCQFRAADHDTASGYGGAVSHKCNRMNMAHEGACKSKKERAPPDAAEASEMFLDVPLFESSKLSKLSA